MQGWGPCSSRSASAPPDARRPVDPASPRSGRRGQPRRRRHRRGHPRLRAAQRDQRDVHQHRGGVGRGDGGGQAGRRRGGGALPARRAGAQGRHPPGVRRTAGRQGGRVEEHLRADRSETRDYRTGDIEVVLDITDDCADFVSGHGDGLLQVFVPHATAGIAVLETGAGSDEDLLRALGDLLPADDRWRHQHGSPGHGRSHVMPALVPPYATVPSSAAARARDLAEHLPGRPQRRQPGPAGAVLLPRGLRRGPGGSRGRQWSDGDPGLRARARRDDARPRRARAQRSRRPSSRWWRPR